MCIRDRAPAACRRQIRPGVRVSEPGPRIVLETRGATQPLVRAGKGPEDRPTCGRRGKWAATPRGGEMGRPLADLTGSSGVGCDAGTSVVAPLRRRRGLPL